MDIKERISIIERDNKQREEQVLHELLELALPITGRGCVSDDYTKFIEFKIGNLNVCTDPYYSTVQINEQEIQGKHIKKLIDEMKKRLLQFDKRIKSIREEIAADIFDKPTKGFEHF